MPELDVDGAVFCFPDGWEASKFDEWTYFRSVMSRIVDPLGRASHGCDVVALHDGDLWLIEAKDYSHPGRLFRGGFEDVEREGRGGGLLGRVLLVRRVVARASECVSRV